MRFLANILVLTALVLPCLEAHVDQTQSPQTCITRAALDIGSGGTKLSVGDIDPVTNRILRIRDEIVIGVKLRRDLALNPDGLLSDQIQGELIRTIKQLKDRVSKFEPVQLSAVATSVFRTAKNGLEVLKKMEDATGVRVRLLSQNEEGEIGFASAIAASQEAKESIIVWDSGSGSFQLTTYMNDNIEMYGAEFGMTPAYERLFAIRGQPVALGIPIPPVSLDEALLLSEVIRAELPYAPEWTSSGHKHVVAIGGSSIFSRAATAIGKLEYHKEEVFQAMVDACSKNNEELSPLIVSLALLYTVMDHCSIETLTYCKTNGSTEGLLTTPKIWE